MSVESRRGRLRVIPAQTVTRWDRVLKIASRGDARLLFCLELHKVDLWYYYPALF